MIEMENFDRLIISLIDSEANKGIFKKEMAQKLDLHPSDIYDVWLESELVNGVVLKYLYVSFNGRVKKEILDKLDYSFIENFSLVFEVGDSIL